MYGEAEAEISVSLRSAWSTELFLGQPRLPKETVLKTKQTILTFIPTAFTENNYPYYVSLMTTSCYYSGVTG